MSNNSGNAKLEHETKYMSFIKVTKPDRKTPIYLVMNKNDRTTLGEVKWHPAFRKYSFFPSSDTVFDKSCLEDIIEFIDNYTRKDE